MSVLVILHSNAQRNVFTPWFSQWFARTKQPFVLVRKLTIKLANSQPPHCYEPTRQPFVLVRKLTIKLASSQPPHCYEPTRQPFVLVRKLTIKLASSQPAHCYETASEVLETAKS